MTRRPPPQPSEPEPEIGRSLAEIVTILTRLPPEARERVLASVAAFFNSTPVVPHDPDGIPTRPPRPPRPTGTLSRSPLLRSR